MSDQMRAAWERRTDTELLHAFFVEELSPQGLTVVTALVTERVGPVAPFIQKFAAQQGEPVRSLGARECHLDNRDTPSMKGIVVLAERGIGFIPICRDDDPGAIRFGGSLGVASALITRMQQTAHPVHDLTRVDLPVPLLAHIAPTAMWMTFADYDELMYDENGLELMLRGERLASFTTLNDCADEIESWMLEYDERAQRDPTP